MTDVKAGIPYLDNFLGGLHAGDNVVWVAQAGTFIPTFVGSFIRAAQEESKNVVIYVNSNYAPKTIYRRYAQHMPDSPFIHVDAFTFGKGKGDSVFRGYYQKQDKSKNFKSVLIEKPSDLETFVEKVSAIEDQYGEEARYVFDSLTGLSELWGGDRPVQEFFTHHCPKLYELQAVAYWVLEEEAHPRTFIANLSHITQMVIQLRNMREGFCEMRFKKAEDRPSSVLYETLRYRVAGEAVEFMDRMSDRDLRVGDHIRELRTSQNLSQAELARLLDVTPSALCQIEKNQVHPSLPLLVDLAKVLGFSLDDFFPSMGQEKKSQGGWLVHKKKDQRLHGGS